MYVSILPVLPWMSAATTPPSKIDMKACTRPAGALQFFYNPKPLSFLLFFTFLSYSTSATLSLCAEQMSCSRPTWRCRHILQLLLSAGHPWNIPSFQSSLILSGCWWVSYGSHCAAASVCGMCLCACEKRQWGKKMKIDHSWLKAEKSKSALLPVSQYACRSGWRRRQRTPKHSWANPLLFPFPYLYILQMSVPLSIMGVQSSSG